MRRPSSGGLCSVEFTYYWLIRNSNFSMLTVLQCLVIALRKKRPVDLGRLEGCCSELDAHGTC